MIAFFCPSCGYQYELPDDQGGLEIRCSTCGERIAVPVNKNTCFFKQQGKQSGPVSFEKLQQMMRLRQLSPDDLVWLPTTKAWKPACEIPDLIPGAGMTPPMASVDPMRQANPNNSQPRLQAADLPTKTNSVKAVAWARGWVTSFRNQIRMRSGKQLLRIGGGAGILLLIFIGVSVIVFRGTPTVSEPASQKTSPVLTVEEIVARSEKAVGLIETPLGHGTGFLIGPDLMATNAHVIEVATIPFLRVYFPSDGKSGEKPHSVERVVYFDRKRDLAILEVKTVAAQLKLASGYQLSKGQTVIVIGNPGLGRGTFRLENAISRGIASSEIELPDGKFLQLNISVNPGNSGGPVFASSGEVIAVIKSRAATQEAIAFAIPALDVAEALEKTNKLSLDQKEQASSQHNARAVYLRTVKAARLYNEGTIVIEQKCKDALIRFKNVIPQDSEEARKAHLEMLRKRNLDHFLEMRDIEKSIIKVGTDARLTETTRQRCADLWKTFESLRNDYLAPIGTLDEYSARCRRNQIALEELSGSLRVILGVD